MEKISRLSGIREKIDDFLTKPAYILVLTILTAISFALGAEVVLYTLFALVAVFAALFGTDLLAIMPLLAFGYVSASTENNPGRFEDTVFTGASGTYVICLGILIAGSVLYRVIRDRKRMFRRNGQLTSGLLILTAAYVVSGIGMAGYWNVAVKNIVFGLLQGLALFLPYWLMTGSLEWEKHRKDYFAWIGIGVGSLLVFELIWIYISQGVIQDGEIFRERIYAGWGMYNNLGNMLAMMIPLAFWMGVYYKKPRVGYSVGLVFLMAVMLTCSRNSMIIAAAFYGLCFLSVPSTRNRYVKPLFLLVTAVVLGILIALFYDQIYSVYNQILDDAGELHSRFMIYEQGVGEFLKHPIFGNSFYPAEGLSFSWTQTSVTQILPARWHNTFIQLLASTGLVGIVAYGFHRYQTLRMALYKKGILSGLMMMSALVLLVGSQFDNYLYSVGPSMFYSLLLAWLEKKE